jgi:hypothetical protein
MAHIRYSSELMTNYISAVAIPAASHIASAWDPQTSQPIVFALSNDETPKLRIIRVCRDNLQDTHVLTLPD